MWRRIYISRGLAMKSSLHVFILLATWALSSAFTLASNVHIKRNSTGLTDSVTWDSFSLSIQGQRIFILSAEYHPWRLPNPNLWADIFEKIKANGFNTVSFYVNWALHYPTPGTNGGKGDFQAGTYRDIQRFIDEAKSAGLWLIARPGPYINAETTGGGFPGWVGNIAGTLRTNNPNYTQAWTPYMTEITKIIARNQITEGGPIILVQAENEFNAGTERSPYMQQVIDLYRENGVVVPITHNDMHGGRDGNFSPDLPGTGQVDIYCGDSYPQSSKWTQVQATYYPYHLAVAPNNPLCLAEFGGGWLLGWGSGPLGGTGYEKFAIDTVGPVFENIYYKENYAQTTKILNVYMLFGGTNWGQTAEPTVYTSYDYGAGINENRVATPKMNEMRLQGLFLRVSRDFLAAGYVANGTNYTSNPLVHTAELRNVESNAGFYIIRHTSSASTDLTTTTLNVSTSVGSLTVPRNGSITLDGRESKILVTDYVFGQSQSRIIYTTTEIFTWTSIGKSDYLVLYAPTSQTGETSISIPGSDTPTVDISNAPGASYVTVNNTVTFNYVLESGIKQVVLSSGARSVIVVILDKATANQWHAPVLPGSGNFGNFFSIGTNSSVLVGGPYLVRTASISGRTLLLNGDINGSTGIEFYAPPSVDTLLWNGKVQRLSKTTRGSFSTQIQSSPTVSLPSLDNWKVSGSLPEIDPDFDDAAFVTANLTTTNYTNLLPLDGEYVLYSQQYGFYGGNLIWRGHFNASGSETAFNLTVQGGFGFGYSAFLNGIFLGSGLGSATVNQTTNVWAIPEGALRVGKDNVLTVIQDHTGIVEMTVATTDTGKEPRGIRGYSIIGGNTTFSYWKLQGNQGGAAHAPDTFRGYLNEGGLYAERIGAHLPSYPDENWASGSPLASAGGGMKGAGVNFYRTTFDLNLPKGYDIPIRLAITPSAITSHYRVQIYLNGWQFGKYINDLGPQTVFVLPAGILKSQGINTLAISLWSLDSTGAALTGLELISDGAFATSLQIKDYDAPDYSHQKAARPKGQAYKAF